MVAYGALFGWLLPKALRRVAERRISAMTGGAARIERLSFHPFAWRAGVRGFSLTESNGQSFMAWSNLVVDAQVSSLWRREVHLREVRFERPSLHLRRDPAGGVNALQWIARLGAGSTNPAPTNGSTAKLFPLTIDDLRWVDGEVVARDDALPQALVTRFAPVDFGLQGLSTREGQGAPMNLHAEGDEGERFQWDGAVTVSPPGATGLVRILSVPLGRYHPYEALVSPLMTTNGVASLELPYRVGVEGGAVSLAVTGARLGITNLQVLERSTHAAFAQAASFTVEGVTASYPAKTLSVGKVELAGGQLHGRRSQSGQSNLRGLVKPEFIEALVRDLTDWRLDLAELSLRECAIDFRDATFVPAIELTADQIELVLRGVSNDTNRTVPAKLETSGRWCGQGQLKASAEATFFPAHATAGVTLTDWSLDKLRPAITKFSRLSLNRGSLSASLQARYGRSTAAETSALLQATGGVALRDFSATDARTGLDFIRWEAVELKGLSVALEPNNARLEELLVQRLQTSLILTTNGQLNVLEILGQTQEFAERGAEPGADPSRGERSDRTTATHATTPPGTSPAAPAATGSVSGLADWPLQLGTLRLDGVSLLARDDFYGGGFKTSVESLDGEIRHVALPPERDVAIDLRGRLTALSGFSLAGTLRPEPGRFAADLRLATERASLAQFTPYSVRFAGYPITRGELTAKVRYQVVGRELKAENELLLDQFTLGSKTNSPDALSLPLKLGVALLKDREGRINLNVPLTGSLDDPKFRLAPVLWQAMKNILVKAATAPFALLGSLFGSKETLEYVEFTPGSPVLPSSQTNRLATLAKALRERPQLQLEILAGFDVESDQKALALAKINDRLKTLRRLELSAAGQPTNAVELATADRPRLLAVLYAQEFGASSNTTTATPPPVPVPTTDPASPVAPPTPEQLEQRLVQTTPITPEELGSLARDRAESVRAVLIATGDVEASRLTIGTATGKENPSEGQARVAFRLE